MIKLDDQKLREIAYGVGLDASNIRDTRDHPIRCPYHDDTHSSGSINFSKQVTNCFAGCGGKGLDKLYKHFFPEAADEESEPASEFIPEGAVDSTFQNQDTGVEGLTLGMVSDDVATPIDPRIHVKEFIESRGIPLEIYKEFGAYPDLEPTSDTYGYIVFPNGNGAQGRAFVNNGKPKYLNSKGDKEVWNLKNVDKTKDVILTEGIFDALSIYSLGFSNVVASLGSASFTEKQAYYFRGQTVFVLFDRDYAGYKGTQEAVKALKSVGAYPISLELPEHLGKDPNEALVRDKQGFQQWLSKKLSQYDTQDKTYIQSLFEAKPLRYLPTGLSKLDSTLGGGFKEGCHAIAGMPGVGKSAFVLFLSKTFAEIGHRVLYVTYEISVRQCWSRLLSMYEKKYSLTPWSSIEMNPNMVHTDAKNQLIELSNTLKVSAGWNLSEIQRASKNFDCIVVDYIQRMPGEDKEDRVRIKQIIDGLSDLARDQGKIILVVSSIPRDKYNEYGNLAIFKETGNIEYVIQSGMVLYPKGSNLGLNVIKNTRGQERDITLKPDLSSDTFEEI